MELDKSVVDGIDALIFDCDNTLAHTAPLHFACLREVLASHGHVIEEAWYAERVGLSGGDLMAAIALRDGKAPDWPAVASELPALYRRLIGGVDEVAHVTAVVRYYQGRLPMAVASGSTGSLVRATLGAIGLFDAFDAVVTLDDVGVGKPEPDLFVAAASRLEVEPARCLVFEDSQEGFEAARRAGMRVLDVATMSPPASRSK
ncbi:HAD family hydrolase [Burkholderia sp. MR1-5-21]